jgi:hypothetical protein
MNKAMKLMMGGKTGAGKWYTYDSQGREIEVRERNFAMETVTTTSYNEHGGKSEVCIIRKDNSAFPAGVPHSLDDNGALVPTNSVPNGSSGGKDPAALKQPSWPKSVTYVSGTICHLCLRAGPMSYGGGGGIRTPVTLSGQTVFKTAGFNHSPTPPLPILR